MSGEATNKTNMSMDVSAIEVILLLLLLQLLLLWRCIHSWKRDSRLVVTAANNQQHNDLHQNHSRIIFIRISRISTRIAAKQKTAQAYKLRSIVRAF